MGLRRLVAKTLLITPSGALSPGPLSAVGVAVGSSLGVVGGLLVALGHMLVELPYVYMLTRFLEPVMARMNRARTAMLVGVAVFLLYFAFLLARDAYTIYTGGLKGEEEYRVFTPVQAIVAGMILTGLNPYFLAWWATVGYPLIEESSRNGVRGFAVMYVSHVWMDYAWLGLLAFGGGASRILGKEVYAGLLAVLALVLAGMAVWITAGIFKSHTQPAD